MAANTVSAYAAMFQVAHNAGDLLTAVLTTYTSDTSFACAGLAEATDDTYNSGLIRMMGGSAYATISDYTGSSRTFTLAGSGIAALSAAGDIVQFCGFNMQKRGALFESINSAIRDSWGDFTRETVVDRSAATLTLAAGTQAYSLPSDVGQLAAIGIQPTTLDTIAWFDPLQVWRVEGEEGAYTLRFLPNFGASTLPQAPAWSARVTLGNSGQTFADAYSGQPLCLRYYGREPELTSESAGTTRLPLNYLGWVGADYYSQWLLANGSDDDRRVLNVSLPQIQRNAQRARAQLTLTKPKIRQPIELDF